MTANIGIRKYGNSNKLVAREASRDVLFKGKYFFQKLFGKRKIELKRKESYKEILGNDFYRVKINSSFYLYPLVEKFLLIYQEYSPVFVSTAVEHSRL